MGTAAGIRFKAVVPSPPGRGPGGGIPAPPPASFHLYPASGRSDSSISSTIFWLFKARSLLACTCIPAVALRQQLGASTRSPAISTTQARQLPSARRPSLKQSRGMSMPWRMAALRMVSPLKARTVAPSSWNSMICGCRSAIFRAAFIAALHRPDARSPPARRARAARRASAARQPRPENISACSESDWVRPGPGRKWKRRP